MGLKHMPNNCWDRLAGLFMLSLKSFQCCFHAILSPAGPSFALCQLGLSRIHEVEQETAERAAVF